jgi:N-alpha-acetyltransferase 15/16, NatA auxiliary subunit
LHSFLADRGCSEKYLLALRCLNAAISLDKDHPRVHEQAIEFRKTLNPILESLPPKVQEVIKSEFSAVPATADLKQLNAEFRQQHKDSPEHTLAAIRTAKLLGEDQAQCEKDLLEALETKNITFDQAASMLETLKQWKGGVTSFQKAAHERWPAVTLFA